MQLLILKTCREDLEEEQNGVEGKCMYVYSEMKDSPVEIIEMLETLFDDPFQDLDSDS